MEALSDAIDDRDFRAELVDDWMHQPSNPLAPMLTKSLRVRLCLCCTTPLFWPTQSHSNTRSPAVPFCRISLPPTHPNLVSYSRTLLSCILFVSLQDLLWTAGAVASLVFLVVARSFAATLKV